MALRRSIINRDHRAFSAFNTPMSVISAERRRAPYQCRQGRCCRSLGFLQKSSYQPASSSFEPLTRCLSPHQPPISSLFSHVVLKYARRDLLTRTVAVNDHQNPDVFPIHKRFLVLGTMHYDEHLSLAIRVHCYFKLKACACSNKCLSQESCGRQLRKGVLYCIAKGSLCS